MRIAVYAISKNEAANVERFVRTASEADYVVVTDTGSRDGTAKLLKQHGAIVHKTRVTPWRFDEARNRALANVPLDVDVCVSADLDESFQPGWRAALEAAWHPEARMGSYEYVAEMRDGQPVQTAWRTKIHARHGFAWRRPIHEVIEPTDGETVHVYVPGMVVLHHRAEPADYLAPLNALIEECPDDAAAYIQRAAEHYKVDRYADGIADLEHYLELSRGLTDALTQSQRALAYVDIARGCMASGAGTESVLRALLHAAAESPRSREAWTYLADAAMGAGHLPLAYGAAMEACAITDRGPGAHDEQVWGDAPKRLADAAFARLMAGVTHG